jgi:hypothetical protein
MFDHHTPWNCRWTWPESQPNGPADGASNWTRALCVRPPAGPRHVTELECARCAHWEPILSDEGYVVPDNTPIH